MRSDEHDWFEGNRNVAMRIVSTKVISNIGPHEREKHIGSAVPPEVKTAPRNGSPFEGRERMCPIVLWRGRRYNKSPLRMYGYARIQW